ncbi:hypothetical protein AB0F77_39635 [Streptomyces sp. NPDC026672]|uniref:hypothetical protein n=1 Tax=Actinomycetes TaxID=1760 RepID=UPI0033E4C4B7
MAHAEKTTAERVVKEAGFTLKLTVDEAEALVAVLAQVGGDRESSPRTHSEGVLEVLVDAGVRTYYPAGPGHPARLLRGVTIFDDYSEES